MAERRACAAAAAQRPHVICLWTSRGLRCFRHTCDAPSRSEEQRVVGEALERVGLIDRSPPHRKLRVELENLVTEGTRLWRAPGTWNESFFPDIGTPGGFPRQPSEALCPAGLVKVSVECVERETPGMGSHFGFAGYYLSVLVSVPDRVVWDVRGEPAK